MKQAMKEDLVLVNEFLHGNKEFAFSKIYDRYYDRIRLKLLIASKDEYLAEDLASEVFMKVYFKLESFSEDKGCFNTWINVIATNHYRDHLRRMADKKLESLETLGNSIDDDGEIFSTFQVSDDQLDPWETMVKDERKEMIEFIIDNSIKREFLRELIRLRYFGELSYDELSDKFNSPLGSIKTNLFRARNMMEKYILEEFSKEQLTLS